ncbi:MAG: TadE/TadG family type IV pilus assembly protein [Actinomycetota bacterium]
MIELAIVAVPLLIILLGLAELGLLWRNALTMDQASRSAARVGANLTNNPAADREALRALVSNLDDDELDQIQYVVLYEVDSTGAMPPTCVSGSTPVCNHYTPTMLTQLDDDSKWECGSGSFDGQWCPTSRSPEFHTPVDMGVLIVAERDWLSGFFGSSVRLTSLTVMRLDPLTR